MKFKLIAIVVLTMLLVPACTRVQVGWVLKKHPSKVTEQELQTFNAIERAIKAKPPAPDLGWAVSLRNHPFLVCTRRHESDTSGGYRALSPGGTYRGAYQFLQSTWNSTASSAGLHFLVGVDPASAHPTFQDMLAMHLYRWQGKAPWNYRC